MKWYQVDAQGLHPVREKVKAIQDAAEFRNISDLQTSKVLVHYQAAKELFWTCDASLYRIGTVLVHQMADGSEQPIVFVSQILSSAEHNSSQLDRDGLAIIFGI